MCKIKHLLFLLSFFISGVTFSQAVNDAGLWISLNLEKKISKRTAFFLTQAYRRDENLTQTNLFYTDIGMSVKPVGFMKVSLSYRSIQKYAKEEVFNFRHRVTMDVLFKKKINNITVSFRERIQTQVREINTSETGKIPAWYTRQKVELKYDLDKPIEPFIAAEFRYQLHDPRNIESDRTWNRARYVAGFDYKMNEKNSCSFFYVIQNSFNVSAPENSYVIGLSYTLSL